MSDVRSNMAVVAAAEFKMVRPMKTKLIVHFNRYNKKSQTGGMLGLILVNAIF